MSSDPHVKHLNQRELAARWCITESTLERWRAVGIGPVYLKIQGRVVYRLSDIESFEQLCLRRSTSQPWQGAAAEGGAV